ncbi:MAG: heme ABC exporter ATP-binding protein CcmA [Planctomycetes bacterium]|nr:heme ABC exporter ATP-binding protein CcmA [Planctomycetota bacterium]
MKLVGAGICKSWGATHVLRGVDFTCEPGTLTALTGANGAGKTTLIRILATILRPDAGKITLGELDLAAKALKARSHLGYLGHESMLDAALTMRENLRMFGALYGVKDVNARTEALIERFESTRYADLPISELSRGQEQAAALCRALIHSPSLLLLDEPSTGLDKDARERLWKVAREQAEAGSIVIFSTHDHDSAGRISDRVVELADGKLA